MLAGLTGPATFAAANLVKRLTAELPWREGSGSEVLWIPIKAKVKVDSGNNMGGDARRVYAANFAGNPMTHLPK